MSPVFAADVRFTEIPAEVRGGGDGAMAVSENGVVTFSDESYFYKWSEGQGLTNLGDRVALYTNTVANISNDGETVAFTGVMGWGTTIVFEGKVQNEISRASIIGSSLSPTGEQVGGFTYGSGSNGLGGPVATYNLDDGTVEENTDQRFIDYTVADFSSNGDVQLLSPKGFGYYVPHYLVSANGTVTELDENVRLIRDLSGDGKTVVGQSLECVEFSTNCTVIANASGYEELGMFFANALNYDGSIAVGHATSGPASGKIWDRINGIRDIVDVLAAKGIDISAWTDITLLDISDSGEFIVGAGVNPQGARRGFIINVFAECSTGLYFVKT